MYNTCLLMIEEELSGVQLPVAAILMLMPKVLQRQILVSNQLARLHMLLSMLGGVLARHENRLHPKFGCTRGCPLVAGASSGNSFPQYASYRHCALCRCRERERERACITERRM